MCLEYLFRTRRKKTPTSKPTIQLTETTVVPDHIQNTPTLQKSHNKPAIHKNVTEFAVINERAESNIYTQNPVDRQPNHSNADARHQKKRKHPKTKKRIYIAQHDFSTKDKDCVSFRKGQELELLGSKSNDWLEVRHLLTGQEGFIPRGFVAEESTLQSKHWYIDNVNRTEANKLLMNNSNPAGTFLVRLSENETEVYILCIKDRDKQTNEYVVKHYKIKYKDNVYSFVKGTVHYNTLEELISDHFENRKNLCHRLIHPCPKPLPLMWDLGPTYKDMWEIPRNEIQLGKIIGSGNFGQVYLGKWKDETDVAVKTLKSEIMSVSAFLDEASIMKTFRHKNLVTLYGVCTKDPRNVYIITEYMKYGDLLTMLKKDKGATLDNVDLLHIAFQIASGMAYLESRKIVHRDLAARNILIGENNIAKVGDFGLTRALENSEYLASPTTVIPIRWTAPECFQNQPFSIKSDVWSYGVLLMELFSYGESPYQGMAPKDVKRFVILGNRMPKPKQVEAEIYSKANECWNKYPEQRPTFEHLENYFEFFNQETEKKYYAEYGNIK